MNIGTTKIENKRQILNQFLSSIILQIFRGNNLYAQTATEKEAIENLFGKGITLKPGGKPFGSDVRGLINNDDYLPAFPNASLRELIRSRMDLKIGYSSDSEYY